MRQLMPKFYSLKETNFYFARKVEYTQSVTI